MEDLECEEALSDSDVYQQELEEAEAEFEELALLLEEALVYAIEVTEDYEELYRDYAELYAYIYEYYAYLEELTYEALSQIDYLMTLLPSLEEIEQLQEMVQQELDERIVKEWGLVFCYPRG